MSCILVITFTGPDQPGIVDRLSQIVATHKGNWEQGRMASLAGRFAGILKVCVPKPHEAALIQALQGLETDDFVVLIQTGHEVDPREDILRLNLELTGADQEGIVARVASVLTGHGINIAELTTQAITAPMSGEPLFTALAELECPRGLTLAELQDTLEQLGEDLMVHIELHKPEGR